MWQALIQVAAAYVHVEAGRFGGASRVLRRAVGRLVEADPRGESFDLERLRDDLQAVLGHLEGLSRSPGLRFDERFRIAMADYQGRARS